MQNRSVTAGKSRAQSADIAFQMLGTLDNKGIAIGHGEGTPFGQN